jgi:hypothetical protein
VPLRVFAPHLVVWRSEPGVFSSTSFDPDGLIRIKLCNREAWLSIVADFPSSLASLVTDPLAQRVMLSFAGKVARRNCG